MGTGQGGCQGTQGDQAEQPATVVGISLGGAWGWRMRMGVLHPAWGSHAFPCQHPTRGIGFLQGIGHRAALPLTGAGWHAEALESFIKSGQSQRNLIKLPAVTARRISRASVFPK